MIPINIRHILSFMLCRSIQSKWRNKVLMLPKLMISCYLTRFVQDKVDKCPAKTVWTIYMKYYWLEQVIPHIVSMCLYIYIYIILIINCQIGLIWMAQGLADDKSTLAQVMAWCCQATSHYLNQCWHRFMSPYGMTWLLTHWGWDRMAAILQTTILRAFSCIKIFELRLKISLLCS